MTPKSPCADQHVLCVFVFFWDVFGSNVLKHILFGGMSIYVRNTYGSLLLRNSMDTCLLTRRHSDALGNLTGKKHFLCPAASSELCQLPLFLMFVSCMCCLVSSCHKLWNPNACQADQSGSGQVWCAMEAAASVIRVRCSMQPPCSEIVWDAQMDMSSLLCNVNVKMWYFHVRHAVWISAFCALSVRSCHEVFPSFDPCDLALARVWWSRRWWAYPCPGRVRRCRKHRMRCSSLQIGGCPTRCVLPHVVFALDVHFWDLGVTRACQVGLQFAYQVGLQFELGLVIFHTKTICSSSWFAVWTACRASGEVFTYDELVDWNWVLDCFTSRS